MARRELAAEVDEPDPVDLRTPGLEGEEVEEVGATVAPEDPETVREADPEGLEEVRGDTADGAAEGRLKL